MKERPSYVAQAFEGKCKIFPERNVILLPYQERWVKDNSRLKLAVKARQIGFSWCTAYRTVRTLAADDARLDTWISSRDEISARLFLEDCKKFADVLSIAATDLGLNIIDESGNTAFTLRFANGTRAFSLSSNADAQAGKRGSRVLDEFALHPDPLKLYQIAYPGTTWGGTLEIFSIHRGSRNFFNELAREITERNNPKGFSFHKITLQDALEEGLLYKLQSKLPADDPRVQMDETDYYNFMRAGCGDEESFQQEFMCQPADDNTAFLPHDLITACEYQTSEAWETDLMDCKNPLYVGVDIGREHDLTVIWLVESVNGVHFTRRIIELDRQTFDTQECALYELLKLPMVRRCCIDRSGLGRQFAERAQKKFGLYRVEGVDFTQGSKEELAYPVRLAFEDRAVRVPFSNAIRADLRGVRKLVTTSGNTRFAGERNAYGHCDRFWALALALYAARRPVTGAITSVEGIRMGRNNVGPRRSFTPRTLSQGVFQGYFET